MAGATSQVTSWWTPKMQARQDAAQAGFNEEFPSWREVLRLDNRPWLRCVFLPRGCTAHHWGGFSPGEGFDVWAKHYGTTDDTPGGLSEEDDIQELRKCGQRVGKMVRDHVESIVAEARAEAREVYCVIAWNDLTEGHELHVEFGRDPAMRRYEVGLGYYFGAVGREAKKPEETQAKEAPDGEVR